MATSLVNGKGQFQTPQNRRPLTDCQKIATTTIPIPNLVQIHPWGLVGKWVKYNKNYFYLFIPPFYKLIYRSDQLTDFTFDGSNDADWRTHVPFLGLHPYCTPSGGGSNCWKTPILSAWIGIFQPFRQILKLPYFWNYCIDRNLILHNDRNQEEWCNWTLRHHQRIKFWRF